MQDSFKIAREGLERLQTGNRRFVEGRTQLDTRLCHTHREELVAGQNPFAIVLGCSDSRVPVEIVFDQGLGDLFVIRVAGNVVEASQIGSVEFAAKYFGARLVVVLGHTGCGAVAATLAAVRRPVEPETESLSSIVDRIRPSVERVLESSDADDERELERAAVRANVRASADCLRHGSQLLHRLTRDDGLAIIGAEYALETGVVEFFDGVGGLAIG